MYVEEQKYKGVVNHPSAPPPMVGVPPPPPPPMSVVNTNGYVNSGIPVTGYAVESGRPGLPCCGIGVGWCLFILGWFLCGIPWYAGAIILFCSKVDTRERPGYIACTIIAVIITILAIIMAAKGK